MMSLNGDICVQRHFNLVEDFFVLPRNLPFMTARELMLMVDVKQKRAEQAEQAEQAAEAGEGEDDEDEFDQLQEEMDCEKREQELMEQRSLEHGHEISQGPPGWEPIFYEKSPVRVIRQYDNSYTFSIPYNCLKTDEELSSFYDRHVWINPTPKTDTLNLPPKLTTTIELAENENEYFTNIISEQVSPKSMDENQPMVEKLSQDVASQDELLRTIVVPKPISQPLRKSARISKLTSRPLVPFKSKSSTGRRRNGALTKMKSDNFPEMKSTPPRTKLKDLPFFNGRCDAEFNLGRLKVFVRINPTTKCSRCYFISQTESALKEHLCNSTI